MIIKLHPYNFSEIYQQRNINNIYYDNLDFQCYNDNVIGVSNRIKARLRWYGNLFGKINRSKIELKIKKGLLGKKHTINYNPFNFSSGISNIKQLPKIDYYSAYMDEDLSCFNPTLLNYYSRKYYLSYDKLFRVTIDFDQVFSLPNGKIFRSKIKDYNSLILELKYNEKYDDIAQEISSILPFRLSKSSKYVRGISLFD